MISSHTNWTGSTFPGKRTTASYLSSTRFRPCDVQGLLDFGLDGAEQVCPHFLQQLSEQDKQPVLQVLPVHCDEVHQSLQEHAEHL